MSYEKVSDYNNFIDLTDINQEQNNQAFVQPIMQNNVNNIMPNNQITQEVQMTAPMQNQVVENPMQPPIDSTNNIINLESLKQNNEMISQPENFNNNILGTINENISLESNEQLISTNIQYNEEKGISIWQVHSVPHRMIRFLMLR